MRSVVRLDCDVEIVDLALLKSQLSLIERDLRNLYKRVDALERKSAAVAMPDLRVVHILLSG